MADCYYHGYGSPGPCELCRLEDQRGEERGTVSGYDGVRMEDADVNSIGRKAAAEKARREAEAEKAG
jgi:hypothetical protein